LTLFASLEIQAKTYVIATKPPKSENMDQILPGFIQQLSRLPFRLFLCSDKQLRLAGLELKKTKNLVLNFDATGSIVRKIPDVDKRILLHSLVSPGNGEGNPEISYFDCLLSSHDHVEISYIMAFYLNKLRQLTRLQLPIIVTDFSWATIYGLLLACNSMSLESYLEKCFKILMKDKTAPSFTSITRLVLCGAHVVKFTSAFVRRSYKKRDNSELVIFTIVRILQQKNLKRVKYWWVRLAYILQEDYITPKLKLYLRDVSEVIQKKEALTDETFNADFSQYEAKLDELSQNGPKSQRNPFVKYLCGSRREDSSEEIDSIISPVNQEKNEYKSDYVFQRAKQLIVNLCPLSTAVMINSNGEGLIGKDRLTNSSVENYFKILKHQVLKVASRPIHVSNFVDKVYENSKNITSIRLSENSQNEHVSGYTKKGNVHLASSDSESKSLGSFCSSEDASEEELIRFPLPETTQESWSKKRKSLQDNSKFYREPLAKKFIFDKKYLAEEHSSQNRNFNENKSNVLDPVEPSYKKYEPLPKVIQKENNTSKVKKTSINEENTNYESKRYTKFVQEFHEIDTTNKLIIGRIRTGSHKETLRLEDLKTLIEFEWLSDKVIDYWISVKLQDLGLTDAMSVFPFPVANKILDGKSINSRLFQKKILIFTILQTGHWRIVIIDKENRCAIFFDPLNHEMEGEKKMFEAWMIKKGMLGHEDKLDNLQFQFYRQTDGHNCGVMCLSFLEFIFNLYENTQQSPLLKINEMNKQRMDIIPNFQKQNVALAYRIKIFEYVYLHTDTNYFQNRCRICGFGHPPYKDLVKGKQVQWIGCDSNANHWFHIVCFEREIGELPFNDGEEFFCRNADEKLFKCGLCTHGML
jgi:hypothetical protein